jgi:hypothetical protein
MTIHLATDGYGASCLVEDLDIARDRLDAGANLLNQALDIRAALDGHPRHSGCSRARRQA